MGTGGQLGITLILIIFKKHKYKIAFDTNDGHQKDTG